MAGTNAIGTGAVVLTATTDKLAANLGKAERDISKFAAKADQKAKAASGGGTGKGILSTILGTAGGVALAATGGKVIGFVSNLFGTLKERAARVQLDQPIRDGVMSADHAVRQLTNTWDTVLLTAVAKLAPMLERMTPAIEAAMYIAEGVFEVVANAVGNVIGEIARWVGATDVVSGATDSAGKAMFGAFKMVATAIGYVWDTLKAGAGLAVQVAGVVARAMGQITRQTGGFVAAAVRAMPKWALMPGMEAAGPVAELLANNAAAQMEEFGQGAIDWGKKAIGEWGQAAAQAGQWVDRIQAKFDRRVKVPKGGISPMQLAGAFGRESKEAYSIVAKYNTATDARNPMNVQKQQLDAAHRLERLMREAVEELRRAHPLKVIG